MRNDGFTDADGILLNNAGITDAKKLSQLENNLAATKAAILKESGGVPGIYDSRYLSQIHKHLFGEIYSWAGETRAARGGFQGTKEAFVTTADTKIVQGMAFAPFKEIDRQLNDIGGQLNKENNLKGLDLDRFAARAAYYLDRYNYVHAFREGNGRTLQAAFTQLAGEAGYDIDFSKSSPEKYNVARNYALIKPHPPQQAERNLQPLKDFLGEVLAPLPGIKAEQARTAPVTKVPPPSPALRRTEILRELEVTGSRIADRWDYMVKQHVKSIVEEPKNLKKHEKELRIISKAIIAGGAKPDSQLYQDAERLQGALDQVKYLAAGKDIPLKAKAGREASQPESHEEARRLFIESAAIISRGLERSGMGAEAEKLQSVVKFLGNVPYIGGINRESTHSAIAAAEKVPGLKAEIESIKSAASVLMKPEQAHRRGRGLSPGRDYDIER